jgi:hypothetical protein
MIKMKQKTNLFFFFFLLITSCQTEEKKVSSMESKPTSQKKQAPKFTNRSFQFSYTAICHMKCWGIKPEDIKNHINQTRPKTNEKWLSRKPCPLFVVDSLEAPSKKEMLSVLFAACDSAIKVLRVISLKDKKACPECKDAKKNNL